MFSVSTEVEDWLKIFILFLFVIYLKVTITIYEKLPKKCIYTIKKSLNKQLI